MKYEEVIELIKSYANQSYVELTIKKPEDFFVVHARLTRDDFTVTYPNPDEVSISWANLRFKAKDALYLAMASEFHKLKKDFVYL